MNPRLRSTLPTVAGSTPADHCDKIGLSLHTWVCRILLTKIEIMDRKMRLELLAHERHALLLGNFAHDEVREQLEADAGSEDISVIQIHPIRLKWLASDLNHAIVKQDCRDDDVIDLCERLEYVDDTGDGSLRGWYE